MGFRHQILAGVLTATAVAHGADAQTTTPPPKPPSITKSDKDRIAMVLLKAYDLQQPAFNKALGVDDAKPATIAIGKPKEINAEYTKAEQIKAICQDLDIDPKGIACISVTGDELAQNYYFLTDKDPMKAEVVATANCVKYETKSGKDAGKAPATFWTSHLRGSPTATRVAVGFKNGALGIHSPDCKCNVIELRYDSKNNAVVPTHIMHSPDGKKTKELEPYPVTKIEEALRPKGRDTIGM